MSRAPSISTPLFCRMNACWARQEIEADDLIVGIPVRWIAVESSRFFEGFKLPRMHLGKVDFHENPMNTGPFRCQARRCYVRVTD